MMYNLVVVGVAATMIGEVLPLGTITLLGIHDLHLPAAVITILHLREGNTQGMLIRHKCDILKFCGDCRKMNLACVRSL